MDTQPMIMDWTISCCQDVSTTQIQIQCKPSQNPKDIFFTLKKNHSKIPIQSQGTLNSQNDFENEQS